ncbi:hypothetical protein [Streptomyces kronopolitis]|uniref:hypothetical protein n=1 Tax=Streptomyces kronopolitis TaxID=1612435 RepID=UPI0020C17BF4|nr:hypothetical protein [Streptomyces kronopolitis]MCL6302851.1 hypothetical protein [Streptomyces kronopolitis]
MSQIALRTGVQMAEPEFHEPTTEVRYKVVPDDQLPTERVTLVVDGPGFVEARIRRGHATEPLCEQLMCVSRHIFSNGLWVYHWAEAANAAGVHDTGTPAEVRFEIHPASAFPKDILCLFREQPGEFVWFVREGHLSEEACGEFNEYLKSSLRAGFWVQRWDEGEAERVTTPY